MNTTNSYGSVPHNLLRGNNYAPLDKKAADKWRSEYTRGYIPKSYVEAFHMKAKGLRSEEMMFVG